MNEASNEPGVARLIFWVNLVTLVMQVPIAFGLYFQQERAARIEQQVSVLERAIHDTKSTQTSPPQAPPARQQKK